LATCDACGVEVEKLYRREEKNLCEHCAPSGGIVPHAATRASTVLRTQVWTYTPEGDLSQITLDEPQASLLVKGELVAPWFVCPSGKRDSYVGVVFAREAPPVEVMNEVVAQARERFKDEPWNK
jgi:hypothetical protein